MALSCFVYFSFEDYQMKRWDNCETQKIWNTHILPLIISKLVRIEVDRLPTYDNVVKFIFATKLQYQHWSWNTCCSSKIGCLSDDVGEKEKEKFKSCHYRPRSTFSYCIFWLNSLLLICNKRPLISSDTKILSPSTVEILKFHHLESGYNFYSTNNHPHRTSQSSQLSSFLSSSSSPFSSRSFLSYRHHIQHFHCHS